MLDFYLLSESENPPHSTRALPYAGGLEADVFFRLVKKGVINDWYDYYSDFRWDNSVIAQISERLEALKSDTDAIVLREIVEKAQAAHTGLFAYGD